MSVMLETEQSRPLGGGGPVTGRRPKGGLLESGVGKVLFLHLGAGDTSVAT